MKPVSPSLATAFAFLLLGVSVFTDVNAEQLAPRLEKLTHEEIGQWVGKVHPGAKIDKAIIRRGLISDQTALRADCAQYLATHGNLSDVPYLIDALSDQTQHVGGRSLYSGMSTTRYWANVALICITKIDLGYRWDDPNKKRKEAIDRWANYWESTRHRTKSAPGPDGSELAKAVAVATAKLRATVEPSSDYKLIRAELTWAKGKYVWLVTYKPIKLLPDDPSKGLIGAGGEVFITVDLKTGKTEVRYGE